MGPVTEDRVFSGQSWRAPHPFRRPAMLSPLFIAMAVALLTTGSMFAGTAERDRLPARAVKAPGLVRRR